MKRYRCYVPDLSGDGAELPEREAHHVRHVLRLQAGADLLVFDGRGLQRRARIVESDRRRVAVALLDTEPAVVEPPVAVTLAVALLKGDQMSAVVRDATALGVSAIAPFVSSHVALPVAAGRSRLTERLWRIAVSSAAQCGRGVVPEVRDVTTFETLVGEHATSRFVCVEPAHGPSGGASAFDRPVKATLLVGPEGGWSDAEVAHALACGAVPLSLGPRTLRAETAPTVALSVLWTRWGWS